MFWAAKQAKEEVCRSRGLLEGVVEGVKGSAEDAASGLSSKRCAFVAKGSAEGLVGRDEPAWSVFVGPAWVEISYGRPVNAKKGKGGARRDLVSVFAGR